MSCWVTLTQSQPVETRKEEGSLRAALWAAPAGPEAGPLQKSNRGDVRPPASPAADMAKARATTRLHVLLGHLGFPRAQAVVSFELRGARAGRVVASMAIPQPLRLFFTFLGVPAPVMVTALPGAGR